MPSRWFSVAIALAWLATTSWLVYTEVVPLLMPGPPPAYSIDMVEEVQLKRPAARWVALRYNKERREFEKVFAVQLQVERVEDDIFDMSAKFAPYSMVRGKQNPATINGVLITRYESKYRVNAAGDLLGLKVSIAGEALAIPFSAEVEGVVRAGKIAPKIKYSAPGKDGELAFEPIDAPRGGSMMMPLHPVNRVQGLYPGKRWTIVQFDPFKDLLKKLGPFALLARPGPQVLHARVRDELKTFTQDGRESPPCFVVDCRDLDQDERALTTWVEQKTGRVLRQEARLNDERWELVRE